MAPSGKDTKILRIGVIQGGKVIEERLIRKKADVCVGSDHKNTFVLAGADVPKSWLLFEMYTTMWAVSIHIHKAWDLIGTMFKHLPLSTAWTATGQKCFESRFFFHCTYCF